MSDTDPTTHQLDVPGARLYYERRGSGPLLLLIGSPMDSGGFAGLANAMADDYTVVTYDPRGVGKSTREDTSEDVTPELQAEDVNHLLASIGSEPAYVFGSSGGAVVGLALITAYPDQVRTLVAHEPPLVELLPDADEVRPQFDDVYDTYRSGEPDAAMQKFLAVTDVASGRGPGGPGGPGGGGGPGGDGGWQPSPEDIERMRAMSEHFLGHLLLPTIRYRPDIDALQAAPARIVVAAGSASKGQLANRTAVALADALGTTVVEFPGDHAGFAMQPEPAARVLREVLIETS
jgi:clorobiocin biosynthesis protein CloN7